MTEGLPKLIKPTDTYPFLLIHVGTNDVAKWSYEEIKSDFEALGWKLKNFGAQIVFSSILPVLGRGIQREMDPQLTTELDSKCLSMVPSQTEGRECAGYRRAPSNFTIL